MLNIGTITIVIVL